MHISFDLMVPSAQAAGLHKVTAPWDFAEIGLHPFMLAWANEEFRDYALLPIFPLRIFRHKSIFTP